MATPAIKVEGISYAFGDIEAVKSISFEVATLEDIFVLMTGRGLKG